MGIYIIDELWFEQIRILSIIVFFIFLCWLSFLQGRINRLGKEIRKLKNGQ